MTVMSKSEFLLPGLAPAAEPLLYTACGLDNIYLLNGFEIRETKYGRGVAITQAEGLHRAIGDHLATKAEPLCAKEVRFLRTYLKMTQAQFADSIATDVQNVGRYERGESPIPGTADRVIRLLYLILTTPDEDRAGLIEYMNQKLVSEGVNQPQVFQKTDDDHWEPKKAA